MMLLCRKAEKCFNSSKKEKSGQATEASHSFLCLVGTQVCAENTINWSNRLCIAK